MAELVFEKLQIGKQSVVGTGVAATVILPVNPGLMTDLNRGIDLPDEDYGVISRLQTGRQAYGLRGSQVALNGELTFETIMYLLAMRFAGGVVPTGVGPYVWTYTTDDASDTTNWYTFEAGDDTQAWKLIGCTITDLELYFDALTAPGNSPWKWTATVFGLDRQPVSFTGALSAPSGIETMEGHLSTLLEGTTATAFASLADTTALVSYKLSVKGDRPRRAYGSTGTDLATSYGIKKPEITIEAMLKQTTTTKTNVEEIFNTAGSPAGERRWRVSVVGSGTKKMTIDHRVVFDDVNFADRDGERVYLVNAHAVKDATLGGAVQAIVTNSVATLT